jgi:predicted nicotinamide N-methyase
MQTGNDDNDVGAMNDIVGDLFDVSTPTASSIDRPDTVTIALSVSARVELEQNERAVAETGGLVWQAGIELSHWIFEHSASLTSHQFDAAIDLGCGSGVAGIALAQVVKNVSRVCFCDFDDTALQLARRNAQRNALDVTRCEFVCASMQSCASRLPANMQCDSTRLLILASDVCYDAQSERGLLDALTALLGSRTSHSRAVIALQERGDLLNAFTLQLPRAMAAIGYTVAVQRRQAGNEKIVCIYDIGREIERSDDQEEA